MTAYIIKDTISGKYYSGVVWAGFNQAQIFGSLQEAKTTFRSLTSYSEGYLKLQLSGSSRYIYSFRGISFKENARRCVIIVADISLTYLSWEHRSMFSLPSDCRTAFENGRVIKARAKNTRLSYTKSGQEFSFEYPEAYKIIAKGRNEYGNPPSVHLEVAGVWNNKKYFISVNNSRSKSDNLYVTEIATQRPDKIGLERISVHAYDFKNNKEIK